MRRFLEQWSALQARVERPELLDLGEGTAPEVRQNFHDMDRVNRWLGGHAALRRFLLPRIRRAAGRRAPLLILDLGSGAAHVPVMLAEWARPLGITLRIAALDAGHRNVGIARERVREYPEISLLSADARELPFQPETFDFVVSTLFLHHLPPAELQQMLGSLASICHGSLILNDLVRSPAAALLFRCGAPLFFDNRLTLHDGLASIGQAYTPPEIREILRSAGLSRARVHHHGLRHRMTVVLDQEGDARHS